MSETSLTEADLTAMREHVFGRTEQPATEAAEPRGNVVPSEGTNPAVSGGDDVAAYAAWLFDPANHDYPHE